jgi:[ribosomal protein S18]-alanine N-acetyltransferase
MVLMQFKEGTFMPKSNYFVRGMEREDIGQVMNIEKSSFQFPWRKYNFLRSLDMPHAGLVCESIKGGGIVGYSVFEHENNKLFLLNIAVRGDDRRLGAGRAMIDKLKAKRWTREIPAIETMVRETNISAQSFFAEQGFKANQVLHDNYDFLTEDAYVMRYSPGKLAPENRLSGFFKGVYMR